MWKVSLRTVGPAFDSRHWQTHFSLHHRVQTVSGSHEASYTMGTGVSFPGVKRQNMKLTTHLHLVPRLRLRSRRGVVFKHKDNFTFT
jgi:hypothetical protein